jgi:predicted ferric reductase
MIKVLGDWTKQLNLLSKVSKEVELDVRGLYASPIASAVQAKQVFCVAGRIGVTPVMSLINYYQQQVEKWEKLTVVWVFRDWALLNEMGEWLCAIQASSPEVNLLCFATSPCPKKFQIPCGVAVFNRRPCLSTKMAQFETNELALKHAFVCGPELLTAEIKKLVLNRKGWRVIVEHF